MGHSWIAVLAGLPLIAAAAAHPTMPLPKQPAHLVEVNFIDRILQESKPRKRQSAHRRAARPAQAKQAAPAVPAIPSVIPVPTPKPGAEAEKATEQPVPTPSNPAETPAPAQPTKDVAPAAPPEAAPTIEQPGTAAEPPHSTAVPTPQIKPEEKAPAEAPTPDPAAPPTPAPPTAGAPAPQGEAPPQAPPTPEQAPAGGEQPKPEEPPPPPIAKEDPEELKACLADLSAIGGKFKEMPSIDDGEGCGIDKPLEVAEVLPGVEVGGAVMRCKTALSLAHWIKDTTQPALNIAKPGRKITGLVAGSTYACRLRNSASTGKISEHARGNAFDVAAFKLDNGDQVEMKRRDDDHTMEGAFQKTATAGACLHFTTVLAPGSDEAHEDHLHLDVMERNNGYRICE